MRLETSESILVSNGPYFVKRGNKVGLGCSLVCRGGSTNMASSGGRQTSVPVSKRLLPPSDGPWQPWPSPELPCLCFFARGWRKRRRQRFVTVPRSESLLYLGLLGRVRNSTWLDFYHSVPIHVTPHPAIRLANSNEETTDPAIHVEASIWSAIIPPAPRMWHGL
jgi:hypothetical protein